MRIQNIKNFMIKKIYSFYLTLSCVVFGMDAIDDRENQNPNVSQECIVLYDKKPHHAFVEKKIVDKSTPREIAKTIKFLKAQERGYRHFYSAHQKEIKLLESLNFFIQATPKEDLKIFEILRSLFTYQQGEQKYWDAISFDFVFHSGRFMEELKMIRCHIENIDLETNEEVKIILKKIENNFRIVDRMLVYYWNNTP
ncbi:MAG: hypothetical protein C0432_02730 [Candidatus Puniceispirillum sp.]|nr:hypothetical protein [Candidatus Pelagibacter sp.]MBA4283191.1 hypothetical protein [Candidatus Puniceispirillum sp.]